MFVDQSRRRRTLRELLLPVQAVIVIYSFWLR
jgi:hypothetical protein